MVDLIADLDIIIMCARGASNESIGKFLNSPQEDEIYSPISNAIDRHLGFRGWAEDLPFNPKRIYDGLDTKDIESFRNIVVVQYGFLDQATIDKAYDVAVLATRLEKLTDEKWI